MAIVLNQIKSWKYQSVVVIKSMVFFVIHFTEITCRENLFLCNSFL